jgi:drug/metabolite transporter (DMT)-like permease
MNPLVGIALVLASIFAFTLMGATVRYLTQTIPLGQVVFARSFVAIIPLLLMLAWQRQLTTALRMENPVGHLTRSLTGAVAMFLNFAALVFLPLAEATAIGFATPLFTVALSALLLGEVVRARRWTAVAVGFFGVLVMIYPNLGGGMRGSGVELGALLAIAGALAVAIAMTQVRHMSRTETTASLVFYFSIVCSLCGLATIAWGWRVPTPGEFGWMIAMGFLGGIGQLMITESYRHAPASVVAPFAYTGMIYSIAIGYVWFGEVPGTMVLVGAAIVIGAGLFVIWREHRLGLDRTEEKRAEGPPTGGPTV